MSTHNDQHAAHSHGGHGGPKIYTANLIALFIFTAITVGASYIDFGQANVAIALAIASCKALLVALFFMHLRWDKPVNSIAAIAGFLFLAIFLGFTVLDTGSRRDPSPARIAPMDETKQAVTPVPASMNPKMTPAPQPKAKAVPKAEGEHAGGETKAEH